MPALSGSQKAYKQARAGIMRAGASRAGYFTPNVVVTIAGSNRTTSVLRESLSIAQARNDEPDTAEFTVDRNPGFTVTAGQEVVIGLGTAANAEFAGQIMSVRHVRKEAGNYPFYAVSCIDWRNLFNRRLITGKFSGGPSDIAAAIIAYADGFSDAAVEPNLTTIDSQPTIDEFICIQEPPLAALARLANLIGGACYIDTSKTVHFWGQSGPSSNLTPTAPVTLTNSLATLKAFEPEYDYTQVRTRVIVEGRSARTLVAVPAGEDAYDYGIPVDYAWMFAALATPGQCRIGTEVVWFNERTGQSGEVARPEAEVDVAASPGDSSISVVSNAALPLVSWYLDSNGNYFWANNPGLFGGIFDEVNAIPASGYGAIFQEIPAGTKIYAVDTLHVIAQDSPATELGLRYAYQAGETVTVHREADDPSAQSVIALVEGGDGIHERFVSDSELSYVGAIYRAQAELDAFSAALVRATWTTYDMNARAGALQVLNLGSPDTITGTLTIDSVRVDFPVNNAPPRRVCTGSTVKLATILDAIKA